MQPSPLASAEFLPFKLDLIAQRVLLVRLTATQRREAAFLDERGLPSNAEGGWLPLTSFAATEAAPVRVADAIFHIGHCGSTLLSRLLDAWENVQALREPLPLRTVAEAWPHLSEADSRLSPEQAPALLARLWNAWSRPLVAGQRTVIKATSSCNGLIAPLLSAHTEMRVVLLDMPLRAYLATLLKSPDSLRDAAAAAGERLRYLHARGHGEGLALHALSLPQQCAMGWLAERMRFADIAQQYPGRVLHIDFERLLAEPEGVLAQLASHLALDPDGVAQALRSPAWGRYAKAQDHGYGREDRAHDLALAEQRHAAEIDEGMRWVEAWVQRYPQLWGG